MKVGEIGNFIKNQSVRKDKVFDFIRGCLKIIVNAEWWIFC